MFPVKKLVGYGLFDLVKDVYKIIICVAIMAGVTFLVGLISMPTILTLILQIVVGIAVYVLACLLLKEKSFYELLAFIKSKGKKNNA